MDKISNNPDPFINLNPTLKKSISKSKKPSKKNKSIFEGLLSNTSNNTEEIDFQQDKIDNDKNRTEQNIEDYLKKIGSLGEKFKKSKELTDLNNYKKLVKDLLKITLDISEKSEKKTLWDGKKKQKITKIHLQIIDKELFELTRIFFSQQQNTFAIAAKIDKIEGILINLFS